MPEIATQTETRDTHRNVYTQCGGMSKIAVTVIMVTIVTKGFHQ